MNEKYKKRIPKFLPVGIAMGILFSASPLASPLTENKVKADVDTFGTVVTTFGSIYDAFLKEPFVRWLGELDAVYLYHHGLENSAYKAPTFQKGEFGISVFDYYKNQNFSKKVKLAYPDGKVEYKTIKHGEQLRIKQAGTIVDLTPDEPDLSKHNLFYVSKGHLEGMYGVFPGGGTGIALTNWQTFYLLAHDEIGYTSLSDKFVREEFPGAYTRGGVLDIRYSFGDLFNRLPEDKKKLGKATSNPASKDMVQGFGMSQQDSADMNHRMAEYLKQHK
ncbi:hypothetical protein ABE244_06795 [Bacillus toyonensis]|uniref:hypothetical protein n=1 Tax=Bacillus toyonensis TaxID=155322 RepID=UPI003D1E2C7A